MIAQLASELAFARRSCNAALAAGLAECERLRVENGSDDIGPSRWARNIAFEIVHADTEDEEAQERIRNRIAAALDHARADGEAHALTYAASVKADADRRVAEAVARETKRCAKVASDALNEEDLSPNTLARIILGSAPASPAGEALTGEALKTNADCPSCGGTGRWETSAGGGRIGYACGTCSWCKGTGKMPDVLVSLDPATAETLFKARVACGGSGRAAKTSEGKRDLAPGDGTRSVSRAAEAPQEPRIDSASASADVEAAPERPVSAGGAPPSDRGGTAGPRSGTSSDDVEAMVRVTYGDEDYVVWCGAANCAVAWSYEKQEAEAMARNLRSALEPLLTAARAEARTHATWETYVYDTTTAENIRTIAYDHHPGRVITSVPAAALRIALDAARAEARAEAIVEAERVAEYYAKSTATLREYRPNEFTDEVEGAREIARRIRALAEEVKP